MYPEYDLISGNVNKVFYQKGKSDQFIHKYNYDADNRITSVQTSNDAVIWETDATYLYYDHGPLAKVITGDKKVQGSDYAYTLQGWLKTVNSENLANVNKDMGGDGNIISKDAFGYSLSYFNNDYQARILGTNQAYSVSESNGSLQGTALYNGNINRMITSVRGLSEEILPTQINLYSYDQLNRIFSMDSFSGKEDAGSFTPNQSYRSNYGYDNNGNLMSMYNEAPKLIQPDDPTSEQILPMDRFGYVYQPGTNKLNFITDAIADNQFFEDINKQEEGNYQYDAIGQLVSDRAEGIKKIDWRVDGKVKSITKFDGGKFINFFYDGLGNRIAKQDTRGLNRSVTTHYTRDAQGNTMGVYELGPGPLDYVEYRLKEHHIYGSSRLGYQTYEFQDDLTDFQRTVGDKRYELSNHLGNVLSVISDRKIINKQIKVLLIDNFGDEQNELNFRKADARKFEVANPNLINTEDTIGYMSTTQAATLAVEPLPKSN